MAPRGGRRRAPSEDRPRPQVTLGLEHERLARWLAPAAAERDPAAVPAPLARRIAAARSGGAPLRPELRREAEARLGGDLTGVRLHEGAEATRLARTLDAKAFTVGSDVFFDGAGPAPQSAEGRELLDHELAHVTQNAGQGPFTGAEPLRLTEPGDAVEREADAAARGAEGGAVTRAPGGERRLGRFRHGVEAGRGARIFADDDSYVDIHATAACYLEGEVAGFHEFQGRNNEARFNLRPDARGVLVLTLMVDLFVDNSVPFTNKSAEELLAVRWPIAVAPNGDITIQAGAPPAATANAGGQLYAQSLTATNTTDTAQAVLTVVNTTTSQSQSPSLTGTGEIKGVGIEISSGSLGSSSGGGTYMYPYTMRLTAPRPEPTVTIGEIAVQKQESVLFAVNKSIVRGAEETKLVRWYHGLSATTRRKITEGEEPITMQGRASATGDPQKNRELSDDRRAAVERILRQIAGSRALIHTSAVGAYETLQPGERDEERAVIVSVMDTFEGSGDAAGTP